MTVYIDIVIIENIIMNFIILYATGLISKSKISYIRIFIGSFLGAIYAVIGYMSILQIYSTITLKILLSIAIVYISFHSTNLKVLGKQILLFYLTSFAFGGVAFYFIYVIKPQEIVMKNGVFLGISTLKNVLLAGVVGFIIIVLAFKIVKTKMSRKDMFCNIKINVENKEFETVAMIDTGNLLKEPISNTPVVVVERTLLYDIFPKEILNNLEKILGGDLDEIPFEIQSKYVSKLKVIPYASLGKQNGMLLGFKVDNLEIQTEEGIIKNDNIIIGIYDKSLTKRGEYRALIGIDLI